MITTKNNMEANEAKNVAWTNIKTPKGFTWSFTMRSDTANKLIEQMEAFEEICEKREWTPEAIKNGKPSVVTGGTKMCAVHNVEMTQRISKKTGKPYFAHSNGESLCFGK